MSYIDEYYDSDEYDSDGSPTSNEEMKKTLDKLTAEQINDPKKKWCCPACKNGPGATRQYTGLQSLVDHAKKVSRRAKIHRDLADLLEKELTVRGILVVPAGESYGKWNGLNEEDWDIVWPPCVVIRNTCLEIYESGKRLGMGTQELLDYFGSYQAVRARHSYGPGGHTGMSLLTFENSAVGYIEADRLSKHFEHQGTHRYKWDHSQTHFNSDGKRQLYGYMATKSDMESFNRHSQGNQKVKFEMKSYKEKVVDQLKQVYQDNQQLKNKVDELSQLVQIKRQRS